MTRIPTGNGHLPFPRLPKTRLPRGLLRTLHRRIKTSTNTNKHNHTTTNMQQIGRKRSTIDKFYTKPDIAKQCLETFLHHVVIDNDATVVEPSAGNGAFSRLLHPFNSLAFDIQPATENVIKQNFLQINLDNIGEKLHFVGNPPFGRQSSLAKAFIKHICSCKFSLSIGFILPKSFKKYSLQRTFPRNYHLAYSHDLPLNSFTVNQQQHHVPCVFQIWVKRDWQREIPTPQHPNDFTFVTKNQEPDFSIRRVGIYAGKIDTDTQNKSTQSHYFIRIKHNIDKNQFEERFNQIKFTHQNTVGPRSISKPELIKAVNHLSLPQCLHD